MLNISDDSNGCGDEDPADMMRVLCNEEALFMTLSDNGLKESLQYTGNLMKGDGVEISDVLDENNNNSN
jgi:hypothetical protein